MRVILTNTPHEFEIHEAPIRGHDWKMIRKLSQGHYALIAGKGDSPDDEEVIIEEYDDPQHRDLWDELSVKEAAQCVYNELMDILAND